MNRLHTELPHPAPTRGSAPLSRRDLFARAAAAVAVLAERRAWFGADAETALQSFVDGLVADDGLPAVSFAVAKDGRLAHAVAAGLADPATGEKATPTHTFRIASVSKPLTSLVVARLFERGALRADAPVHELLGLAAPADARWKKVTIAHLLHHTGGWDRDVSFDPMFRSREVCRALGEPGPATPAQVIAWMLQQPLDFDPGARTAYSNFGYCLLGRVIEKVLGKTYEQATRAEVLHPLGIDRMVVGRTARADRRAGEVVYIDSKGRKGASVLRGDDGARVDQPYGCWSLEAMDSHGGWIAAACDLVRWAVAIDAVPGPALLKPESTAGLWTRPEHVAADADTWYARGWQVRRIGKRGDRINAWHAGSLPGTGSILVRRHDGLVWALLANTDADRTGRGVSGFVDGRIHRAVDAARPLADRDLFASLGLGPR